MEIQDGTEFAILLAVVLIMGGIVLLSAYYFARKKVPTMAAPIEEEDGIHSFKSFAEVMDMMPYQGEADAFYNRTAIIEQEPILANTETPDTFVQPSTGDLVSLEFADADMVVTAKDLLGSYAYISEIQHTTEVLHLKVDDGVHNLPEIMHTLQANNIAIKSIHVPRHILDDIILKLSITKSHAATTDTLFNS